MTLATLPDHDTAAAEAAVIQTLPLFEMMRMRAATTARRHPTLGFASDEPGSSWRWVNQFTHTHRRLGPAHRHDRIARQGTGDAEGRACQPGCRGQRD